MAKKPLYRSLYFQVICAILLGVALGHFAPETGAAMKPLGDGFIKLIKMIIAPIIFCTVVVGIAGMEDMKKVGKTGGLALLYFEIVSTIALFVGLLIVNLVAPGDGMNINPASLDTKGIAAYTGPGKMQTTVEFLLNVIPSSVVDAFANGEILQVLGWRGSPDCLASQTLRSCGLAWNISAGLVSEALLPLEVWYLVLCSV
ncbi:MAG: cation:dicarboxylase symporter family transporter, partial [Burkholderiales bacterium]|nr:cation:dicarboxylase symporter family transporter [Burkholderiales bacterium]